MLENESVRPEPEQPYTLEALADTMPHFSREAVEAAVETLTASGVLSVETGPAGERLFRYKHPDRYKLINTPVIKQPGPDFGKR